MNALRQGDELSGFKVVKTTQLKTAPAVVYELEHPASGAKVVHYSCDDAENLFSISFPTPPSDDTGLPHIMEHSVLSGSEKYPLKDPFFAMAKVSMATFLNAMTGSDCTYYPVASNVKQDIFNLANVYFDAVFHPLLTKDIFEREAHHLAPIDPESPTGPLAVRGVVYNEMQAYAADPSYRMWYQPMINLLEGTIYVYESGGDPAAIPDLTFEQFSNFHKTFYQPANAHFFLYGDVPTEEWMAFLADRISDLNVAALPEANYTPAPFKEPRQTIDSYPIGETEPDTERTYFGMFWLAGNSLDPNERILMKLLSTVLLGNDAAPLKKAIVDSKLGTGLSNSGDSDIGPQIVFSVGLKGSEPNRAKQFEDLVMRTLSEIAEQGIDRQDIEAAFQQVAYSDLEISSGYPLTRMSRAMNAWIHGKDPITFLETSAHLQECRDIVEKDPNVFCRLIRERFLENNHRLFHTLTPDRQWQKNRMEEFLGKMKEKRESLSDEEASRIAERAAALEELSGTQDSTEALATLPRLQIKDLPQTPSIIPVEWSTPNEMLEIGKNDVFSNGINYLEAAIDISGLPSHLWQYVPRFCQAFTSMGTNKSDYTQIARRKAACTGGVHITPRIMTSASDPSRCSQYLVISLKTLDGQINDGLEIVDELLFGLKARDMDRLTTISQAALTDARKNAIQDAMHTANVHSRRSLSVQGYLAYLTEGLYQLNLLEGLFSGSGDELDKLAGHIEEIRDFVMSHGTITAGFTGSDHAFDTVHGRLSTWTKDRTGAAASSIPQPDCTPSREGLAASIDISYCSCPVTTVPLTDPGSPLIELGSHLVSHDYMLQEVRIKGTAYGAGFRYTPHECDLNIFSYRDPQIARTLGVISAIPDYVKDADWSKDDMEQAAIAVTKAYLRPIRPAAANSATLNRKLIGVTDEMRTERFAGIKAAQPDEVKSALLAALENGLSSAPVCVVSNRAKLEEANVELERPLDIEDLA